MQLVRYLLGSILTTLILVLLVAGGVVGYRYATFSQIDDAARMDSKNRCCFQQ